MYTSTMEDLLLLSGCSAISLSLILPFFTCHISVPSTFLSVSHLLLYLSSLSPPHEFIFSHSLPPRFTLYATSPLNVRPKVYQGDEAFANLHLGGLWSLGPNMCLIQFKKAPGVGPHSLLLNNERPMLPDRETRQACLSLSQLNVILLSTFTKGYWTYCVYVCVCVFYWCY